MHVHTHPHTKHNNDAESNLHLVQKAVTVLYLFVVETSTEVDNQVTISQLTVLALIAFIPTALDTWNII